MNNKCKNCSNKLCASKVTIFSTLTNQELIQIISMTGHEAYNKGDTIFFEGKEANTLYLINKGKIKLFKYTKDGREQILDILSEGDFFGELNLFKEGEYSFNAEAVASTKLCTLTKENMRDIILARPEISLKILEVIGERLAKLETLAQNLATNDIEVRIANLICDLRDKYGENTSAGIEIKLPITREDMSHYAGVARETISRKLKKFEEEGIIKLIGNKKMIILDEEKLEYYI